MVIYIELYDCLYRRTRDIIQLLAVILSVLGYIMSYKCTWYFYLCNQNTVYIYIDIDTYIRNSIITII